MDWMKIARDHNERVAARAATQQPFGKEGMGFGDYSDAKPMDMETPQFPSVIEMFTDPSIPNAMREFFGDTLTPPAPTIQRITILRDDKRGTTKVIDHLAIDDEDRQLADQVKFLKSPKGKLNLAINGIGILVAHLMTTVSIGTVAVPAETQTPQNNISADKNEFFCNADAPVIWNGEDQTIILTQNHTCERLEQAIPTVKETVEYTSQMAVSGLESGGYFFKITGKKPVGISNSKYQAFINGWLITGGQAQNPVPFPSYMAQYFQESRLGQYDKAINGNACGAAQIMPDTYPELVRKYGSDHGLTEESQEITAIKDRTHSDKRTARSGTAREIFRDTCKNPTTNVALSTRMNLDDAKKLQAIVKSGKLELPEGRQFITGADVYITHLLGRGSIQFDKNGAFQKADGALEVLYYLTHNPNKLMNEIVRPSHYASNRNMFEKRTPVLDAHGKTMKDSAGKPVTRLDHVYTVSEFYERLYSDFAFAKRPLPDLSNWDATKPIPTGQYNPQDFANSFNTKSVNDDNAPTYNINMDLPIVGKDGKPVVGNDDKPLVVHFNSIRGFRLNSTGNETKYRAIIQYQQPTALKGYLAPRIVGAQEMSIN